ncbi:fibrinogen-like YCDxxxxGGGW domain-containing protein [Haliangium ochraceum]|uniref:Cysteine-rich repeat protein n=1 Tax=Haliangium ochraceum (strain DSM 14365 / JCM 11303 / SMP-2) TaxID=502025 RepID=D0LWR2_HALO1|nr:fibrinogen-like YCDxxxxGGGW domain-containing protein [Haliangium ochraceum]ACY14159.1 cysteine-rich repeat protein [Haliangium ochraceum DSM 14365]
MCPWAIRISEYGTLRCRAQGPTETDVDCGGTCPPCTDGLTCEGGEDCLSQVCSAGACAVAECGDGVVIAGGEECDDGGPSATCNADCTAPRCGDGTTNPAAGEQCDDGNNNDEDGCLQDCTLDIQISCAAPLAAAPSTPSGFYDIDPDLDGPAPVRNVYCDMEHEGGGWTNLDFTAGIVYLENGNFANCTQGLSSTDNAINCQFPHVNGDAGRWMYHFNCDGSDDTAAYILDHMAPIIGHQSSLNIGGWASLSQRHINESSLDDQEFCYVDGQWVHYTAPSCQVYSDNRNGNCAINEFIINR